MAGKLTCKNIETTQASSVVSPSIVGPDTAWIGLPGSYSSDIFYRKLPTGLVMLKVNEDTSVPEGVVGTLPAGYWPSGQIAVLCQDALEHSIVKIYYVIISGANGTVSVVWAGTATGYVEMIGMETGFMAGS